jgi:hypothetical protein
LFEVYADIQTFLKNESQALETLILFSTTAGGPCNGPEHDGISIIAKLAGIHGRQAKCALNLEPVGPVCRQKNRLHKNPLNSTCNEIVKWQPERLLKVHATLHVSQCALNYIVVCCVRH